MKNYPTTEVSVQDEDIKKEFILFAKKFKELESLLPAGKNFTEATQDQKQKIKTKCNEIASIIDNELKIKPDPEGVYNFFLSEIDPLSFWQNPDMDELIVLYSKWRKKRVEIVIHQEEIYYPLFVDLINAKYISTSIEVFNSVMLYKQLPGGAEKIQWLTSQADALYFQENFKFSIPQLNECFRSKNGNPFQLGSRSTTVRKKVLTDIIDRYKE